MLSKKIACVLVWLIILTLPVCAGQLTSNFKTIFALDGLNLNLTNNFEFEYVSLSDMVALDFSLTADWLPNHITKTFQLELEQLFYSKDLGIIRLTGGRKQVKWGPGHYSGLVLSQTSPSLDSIAYELEYKGFKYQRLYSMLDWKIDKQLQSHRLEVNLIPNMTLGVTETAITSGKINPLFYNPIPLWPLYWSQHLVTPKDAEQILYRVNIGVSADFTYTMENGMMVYGELFVDDAPQYAWEKIMDKRAGLAGFYIPQITEYMDFRVEYARLHNYLYSHRNKEVTYTKGDELLGYIGGPDSDHLIMESNIGLSNENHLVLGFNYHQKGEGTVDVDWQDDPDWSKHQFLSGVVEKQRDFVIGFRNISDQKDNYSFILTFYIKNNVDHVAGQNDHGYQVSFQTHWDCNALIEKIRLFKN